MTVHTVLLALFGGSGGSDDLDEIAALLESEPSPAAIERELESLRKAIDTTYSSVEAQLNERKQVPVDAAPRRKAEAIQRAVRAADRQSPGDGDADAVIRAAANVREDRSADSTLARRLLDRVADERSSSHQLTDVFETVTQRLDERARAESALDGLEASAGVDSVPELVEAYQELRHEQHASASDRDRLRDAVEGLLDELGVETDGTLEQRVRTATREVRADAGDSSGTDGSLGDAVHRARDDANPRSRPARDLFDALEAGSGVESALTSSAARLDEAVTAGELLDPIHDDAVTALADDVAAQCAAADGPVADALQERADDLGDRVAGADDSNRVMVFAANEELTFYSETLLDDVIGSEASHSSEPVGDRLGAVRERREAFESDFVEERSDHNHSIPLYFLSLVDEGIEDVETDLAAGHESRAAGTLTVVEQLLDRVEGLYEQNQYSVMLRSLRG